MGLIPYTSFHIVISVLYITFFSWVTNILFSKIFKAPTNIESLYITALILSFIITPTQSLFDLNFLWFAFLSAILASASKYIFAIRKKHIFNPVAIAVLVAGILTGQAASWWVGTVYLIPVVVIFGLILLRKILRFELVVSFLLVFIVSILTIHQYFGFLNMISFTSKAILYSPVLFFAFIMLTEPLTSPTTRWMRIVYGIIVAIFFDPLFHIGTLYFTPELALVIGNTFSFIVSPKTKLVFLLKEKVKIAFNTYDFVFRKDRHFSFKPGQYMEWTLPHNNIDNRGNRRYFTIASSPTEENMHIGVKFYSKGSSFKKSLMTMSNGDVITASQISGDFILPKDINKKLVFLAGGIGITPFRSMIKNIIDKREQRDIYLLYFINSAKDIAYTEILNKAKGFGINVIYIIANVSDAPDGWNGEVGYLNIKMIKRIIPDFRERIFYISGPHAMVKAGEKILHNLGLKKKQIKSDFFPGLV
ncbi:MAG TPA: oxidoreductase [Candidatus Kaiserbacteria bacterium]|nr:oxidoreductase [Candidatus Kaiserbacteria bacterium]